MDETVCVCVLVGLVGGSIYARSAFIALKHFREVTRPCCKQNWVNIWIKCKSLTDFLHLVTVL